MHANRRLHTQGRCLCMLHTAAPVCCGRNFFYAVAFVCYGVLYATKLKSKAEGAQPTVVLDGHEYKVRISPAASSRAGVSSPDPSKPDSEHRHRRDDPRGGRGGWPLAAWANHKSAQRTTRRLLLRSLALLAVTTHPALPIPLLVFIIVSLGGQDVVAYA
jgi:hypothetical protein